MNCVLYTIVYVCLHSVIYRPKPAGDVNVRETDSVYTVYCPVSSSLYGVLYGCTHPWLLGQLTVSLSERSRQCARMRVAYRSYANLVMYRVKIKTYLAGVLLVFLLWKNVVDQSFVRLQYVLSLIWQEVIQNLQLRLYYIEKLFIYEEKYNVLFPHILHIFHTVTLLSHLDPWVTI